MAQQIIDGDVFDEFVVRAAPNERIPVDVGGATVNITGNVNVANEVEVKNDSGNPVPASVASLPLPSGAATAANQSTANTSLGNIDTDLGALADAAASSDTGSFSVIALIKRLLGKLPSGFQQGSGNVTATTTRVVLASDGPTVSTLTSIDGKQAVPRTPTTTSVASSATSVTILASNANRRGFSISNVSTSKLYLSFSTPATTTNSFIEVPSGAFLLLDQQMIVPSAIYGIWASANGTAQVTEYV